MAIFEERTPSPAKTILFLIIIFLCSYQIWFLGSRELFRNEGIFVTAASEIQAFPPAITLHGVQANSVQPLTPLIAGFFMRCGMGMELAIRLISVVSLFGLSAIVWLVCRRNSDTQAAAAGAAVMFTTFIVAEKAVEGYPQMLSALILFAGWQVWIAVGLGKGNWNLAWIYAGIFGGLAYYNGGFTDLIYFFVPLVVQRRPLTIWPKFRKWGFFAAVAAVTLFVLFYFVPRWLSDNPQTLTGGDPINASYFTGLLMFPLEVFLRLMPWSLMLWAPFCAALIPLDPSPVSGRFHRILFWSLVILVWLNPESRVRDLIYLAPVTAVMCGMNYRIVVRRYGYRIHKLLAAGAIICFCAAACVVVYAALPDFVTPYIAKFNVPQIDLSERKVVLTVVIECAAALLCAVAAFAMSVKKSPVWMTYCMIFCGTMFICWGVLNPYKSQNRAKSELAGYFGEVLKNDMAKTSNGADISETVVRKTVYGLYSESCYFKFKMKYVTSETLAEEKEPTVYVLGTESPPVPERNWTRIGERTYKNELRLYLYKGVLIGEIRNENE